MNDAQKTFEAVMRGHGYEDFEKTAKGQYKNSSIQTRWRYFLLGWEMRSMYV